KTGTRAGVSITGIAGPDGGTPAKPVGTIFVAVSLDGEVYSIELKLNGDRERVRHMACLNALNLLRKRILGL
ncbi:MAG: CinA family protein, partial [Acetivibrionales bacterium]